MPKQRCAAPGCNKRIGLADSLQGKCRCKLVFCERHRLPEQHSCSYVYEVDAEAYVRDNECVADRMESTNGSFSRLS